INCTPKVPASPCGVCETCTGIEEGEFLDVIEMDAASNNGIDDMRDLKEKSIYNPSSGGKKVYIIDEVHMLSTSAFNGFLKLLEEPPGPVVFILATPDVQKLPATIISRCQRFDFKRIREEDIAARCLYVAGEEGIDLTPGGAKKIASLSDGAMRNALSALEQLAGTGGTVDEAAVASFLGLAGSDHLVAAANAIAVCDTASALRTLDELYSRGVSASNFLNDLSLLFRDAAVTKAEARVELLGSGYSREALEPIAARLGYERLIYHIGEINETVSRLRTSSNARVDTELCLIKLCNPAGKTPQALAARLDAVEKRLNDVLSGTVAVKAAPTPKTAEEKVPEIPKETKAPAEVIPQAPKKPMGELTPVKYKNELMRELRSVLPLLAYTQLSRADFLESEGYLVILCKTEEMRNLVYSKETLHRIAEKAAPYAGKGVEVSLRVDGEEAEAAARDGFSELLAFGRENPDIADIR
ncbi:MAG: DNA polymerase III subunit gamma/tau, partial [Clostridia bacterium]|nr:DNA polymerase III subunit gamma/tau [Clostridia bacterium]